MGIEINSEDFNASNQSEQHQEEVFGPPCPENSFDDTKIQQKIESLILEEAVTPNLLKSETQSIAHEQPTKQLKVPQLLSFAKEKFIEAEPKVLIKSKREIDRTSRRDFLIYSAGVVGAAAGFTWLLPDELKMNFGLSPSKNALKERFFQDVLSFDDQVAKSLYSPGSLVPTYIKSQITELPNNYAGETPSSNYLAGWKLSLAGLKSGDAIQLCQKDLFNLFEHHKEITRMCCVEGWSAISWGGISIFGSDKKISTHIDN